MENDTVVALRQPGEFEDLLTDVLRQGARKLLAQAIEAEVADFLAALCSTIEEFGCPDPDPLSARDFER